MKKINNHKDLIVWQRSIELVREIYLLTEQFPKSELFGLTSQMRRAAVSISSNIAEGRRRLHKAEFIQFLNIAYGSGAELETQIEIAKHLPFGEKLVYTRTDGLLLEVMKMLNKMISTLRS
ncbi:MAG TPA: four helix bundle protein [Candidatus Paceibacterota bacterium]|nr:four helix bundle protein [Candidatus Paceibacterota bacterium]